MEFPDTTLIKRAEAYVRPLLSEATLSHSERSFLYGREYGRAKRLHFDEETLYLASLFHDVGLGRPEKGKVFQEVKQRPLFIVDEALGFSEDTDH